MRRKAEDGVQVRLLYGDPESDAVALRGAEEGIGDGLAARIRLALGYMREAFDEPGVSVRLHGTTLYNSLYRYDDELLVNSARVRRARRGSRRCCTCGASRAGGCSITTWRASSACGQTARPLAESPARARGGA